MDNRIFNVNGRLDDREGNDNLLEVLKLALKIGQYGTTYTVAGWKITPQHGLILYRHTTDSCKDVNKFPVQMTAEEVCPMVLAYLRNDETWKNTKFEGWDVDEQHDGHNKRGWRVYCEDWGRVADGWSSVIAIRPAWMWFGK